MRKTVTANWVMDWRRSLIPISGQIIISLFVVAALLGAILAVQARGRRAICCANLAQSRQILWLLVPISISYFTLVVDLAFQGLSCDRDILGLTPFAIALSLWLYQRCVSPVLPRVSWIVLMLWAVFAVAGTHDWFAWQRARLAAIHEITAADVPRTAIKGGFEYDGWTQLICGGYVNDPRIKFPRDAYHPVTEMPSAQEKRELGYMDLYPDIHPKYAVGFGPRWSYLPSRFPAVQYTACLPPFRRTISVQRISQQP